MLGAFNCKFLKITHIFFLCALHGERRGIMYSNNSIFARSQSNFNAVVANLIDNFKAEKNSFFLQHCKLMTDEFKINH